MKKPADPAEATQVADHSPVVKTSVDHPESGVSVYPSEIDGFSYPTFYTASFDYFATGEGMTIGIVMGYAVQIMIGYGMAFWMAPCSCATTGAGSPAGPMKPYQTLASKPG